MLPWRNLVDSTPPAVHVPPGFSSDAVAHMVVQVLEVKLFYCQSRKCKNILRKSLQILCASDDYHWVADSYRTRSTQTALASSRKETCLLDLRPPEAQDTQKKVQDDALSTSTPSHEDRKWKRHSRGTCTRPQDELHKNRKIQTSFSKHNVKLQTRPIIVQDGSVATDSLYKSHVASECRTDDKGTLDSVPRRHHVCFQTTAPPMREGETNTDAAEDGTTQTDVSAATETCTQTDVNPAVETFTQTDVGSSVETFTQTHVSSKVGSFTQTDINPSVGTHTNVIQAVEAFTQTAFRKRHVVLQTRRIPIRTCSTNTERIESAVSHKFTQVAHAAKMEDCVIQTDDTRREQGSQASRPEVPVRQCTAQTEPDRSEVQTQTTQPSRTSLEAVFVQTCPTTGDCSAQTDLVLESRLTQEYAVQTDLLLLDSRLTQEYAVQTDFVPDSRLTQEYAVQTDWLPCLVQNSMAQTDDLLPSVVEVGVQTRSLVSPSEMFSQTSLSSDDAEVQTDVQEPACVVHIVEDKEVQTDCVDVVPTGQYSSDIGSLASDNGSMDITNSTASDDTTGIVDSRKDLGTQVDWTAEKGTQTDSEQNSTVVCSTSTSTSTEGDELEPESADESLSSCHRSASEADMDDIFQTGIRRKRRNSDESRSECIPKKIPKTRHRSCGSLTFEPTFAAKLRNITSTINVPEEVREDDTSDRLRIGSLKEPLIIPLSSVEPVEDPRVTKMMIRASQGNTRVGTSVYDSLVKYVLNDMLASGVLVKGPAGEECLDVLHLSPRHRHSSSDLPYSPSKEWEVPAACIISPLACDNFISIQETTQENSEEEGNLEDTPESGTELENNNQVDEAPDVVLVQDQSEAYDSEEIHAANEITDNAADDVKEDETERIMVADVENDHEWTTEQIEVTILDQNGNMEGVTLLTDVDVEGERVYVDMLTPDSTQWTVEDHVEVGVLDHSVNINDASSVNEVEIAVEGELENTTQEENAIPSEIKQREENVFAERDSEVLVDMSDVQIAVQNVGDEATSENDKTEACTSMSESEVRTDEIVPSENPDISLHVLEFGTEVEVETDTAIADVEQETENVDSNEEPTELEVKNGNTQDNDLSTEDDREAAYILCGMTSDGSIALTSSEQVSESEVLENDGVSLESKDISLHGLELGTEVEVETDGGVILDNVASSPETSDTPPGVVMTNECEADRLLQTSTSEGHNEDLIACSDGKKKEGKVSDPSSVHSSNDSQVLDATQNTACHFSASEIKKKQRKVMKLLQGKISSKDSRKKQLWKFCSDNRTADPSWNPPKKSKKRKSTPHEQSIQETSENFQPPNLEDKVQPKPPEAPALRKKVTLKRKNNPSEYKCRKRKIQMRKRSQKSGTGKDKSSTDTNTFLPQLQKSPRAEYLYDESPNCQKMVFVDEECKSVLVNRKLIVRIERIFLEKKYWSSKRSAVKKKSEILLEDQKSCSQLAQSVEETKAIATLSSTGFVSHSTSNETAVNETVLQEKTALPINTDVPASVPYPVQDKDLLLECRDCAFRDIAELCEGSKEVSEQMDDSLALPSPCKSPVTSAQRGSVIMSTRVIRTPEQVGQMSTTDEFTTENNMSAFSTVNWNTGQVHIQSYAQMNTSNPLPSRSGPTEATAVPDFAQQARNACNFMQQTNFLSDYLRQGNGVTNYVSQESNPSGLVRQRRGSSNMGPQSNSDDRFQQAPSSSNFIPQFRDDPVTQKPIATCPLPRNSGPLRTGPHGAAPDANFMSQRVSRPSGTASTLPMPQAQAPPYFMPHLETAAHSLSHARMATNFLPPSHHSNPVTPQSGTPSNYLPHATAASHYLQQPHRSSQHFSNPNSSFHIPRTNATPHPQQFLPDSRYLPSSSSLAHLTQPIGFGAHHTPKTTAPVHLISHTDLPATQAAQRSSRLPQTTTTTVHAPQGNSTPYLLPQTSSSTHQVPPAAIDATHSMTQTGKVLHQSGAPPYQVPQTGTAPPTSVASQRVPQRSGTSRQVPQARTQHMPPQSAAKPVHGPQTSSMSYHVPQSGGTAQHVPHTATGTPTPDRLPQPRPHHWPQSRGMSHLGLDPYGVSGFVPSNRSARHLNSISQSYHNELGSCIPQRASETPGKPQQATAMPHLIPHTVAGMYYGRATGYHLPESLPSGSTPRNSYFAPHMPNHNGPPVYPDPNVNVEKVRMDPRFSMRQFNSPQDFLGFTPAPYDPTYYDFYNSTAKHSKEVTSNQVRIQGIPGSRPDPRLESMARKAARVPKDGTADAPIILSEDAGCSLEEIGSTQRSMVSESSRRGRPSQRQNEYKTTESGIASAGKDFGAIDRASENFRQEVSSELNAGLSAEPSRSRDETPVDSSSKTLSCNADIIYEACRIVFLEEPTYQETSSDKRDGSAENTEASGTLQISSEN